MPLTENQQRIFELLEGLDPKIAETYKGGILVLNQEYPEKITQSAHSIREVIYLLSRLDEIKKLGKVKTRSEGSTRKKDLIKNLDPVQIAPEDIYILYDELTKDKLSYFAMVAHHSEFPNEKKYRKKLEEFEILIQKVLKPHFDVIAEINETLKIERPTKNDFEKMKHLIARNSSSYNYFFQNASANWLSFLVKGNYIKNPPHVIKDEKGIRFAPWPLAHYLWKISSQKPKEILRIILNFHIPKKENERNPWLLDYFVKAAINMPPKYSKFLALKIYKEKWTNISYHNYLDKPISQLMIKLADAGYENEVILLARCLLDVKMGEPYVTGGILEDYKTVRAVKPVIDDYFYGELLKNEIPYIFHKFPNSVIRLLIDLVTKMIYLENVGRGDKKSKTDASVGWRPAIEDHEQNLDLDFRSKLLGQLNNFMIELGKKSIPSLKQILKNLAKIDYPAFRRLELGVYWNYPKNFKKEVNIAIEKYFNIYELHHEYFHLLKNTFQFASKETRKKYLLYVERGPREELLELWKKQAEQQEPGFLDFKMRFWKLTKLKPIINNLTGSEKKQFTGIIDKEVELPHPDFNIHTSGMKRIEPISELKDGLSPADVFQFMKNYKPKKLDFEHYDGTSEKFLEYVKNDPESYSKLASKLENFSPDFIHKFLDGIKNAINQKKNPNWKQVLSLCSKIIDSIKKGKYGEQKEINLLDSIASLLEQGIGSDSIDFAFRDQVWKLLKALTIMENTDDSWEGRYPGEDWDAFGISINTTNGISFHAILKYAIWCNSHLKKNKQVFVPEVKEILSDYLDKKLPNTISRQAVIGHHLPTLYYFDKEWIRQELSKLFKNENEILSRAAWDGYLVGNVYRDIFGDLTDAYDKHLKKLNKPPFKNGQLWEFDRRVIQHITLAYLFRYDKATKLFSYMIDHSHERALAHCAWYIGTLLREQKIKPSKFFDSEAFRKIWKNSKLTSNEELRTWLEYSPFDKNETIQLLLKSLEKSTKSIKFLSLIVEQLGSYAEKYPQLTVKCLELIIHGISDDPEIYMSSENLKKVFQILLNSMNKTAKKKTISLINYLGELNHNEYRDLLENNPN